MLFADVIVDISHENLDKTYQYMVKPEQVPLVRIGAMVYIPFGRGNRKIKGYIVGISHTPCFELGRMKELISIPCEGIPIESQLIHLAYWMKQTYGAALNDALKTVIPVKQTVKHKERRYISLRASKEEALAALEEFRRKKNKGRVRLLEALLDASFIEEGILKEKLGIAPSTIKGLIERGIISSETKVIYRNPVKPGAVDSKRFVLNKEQAGAVEGIVRDYKAGARKTYLLHGVTGSGKTEVYMEVIEAVLEEGKQVIMLIPEIALTYQTVMRFYKRFGERISILNSRMSKGERYDQYTRAKTGEISIIIGPRSALFAPFSNLGLIIMDEEHESSYKSEGLPKYHARETAIERARLSGASVILGSATPSVESYYKAEMGKYELYTLKTRAGKGTLPGIQVVDLREELKERNKSIFSRSLRTLILDRLNKKEQIMLFINRRGYAGFVSCRSCGHVLKCPHCDISLTSHNNGQLLCHYCGYEEAMPRICPVCSSPYIAGFGTGTQKIEELVKKEFPMARVLRMDTDTTRKKEGHAKILEAFANHEADILVGTQMIVKGHDFPRVTLVGILAADLSLYAGDYRASERTFQLLCQAAGRAGRGSSPGDVVIQTYNPDHYSIRFARDNDYESFYRQEMAYRNMLDYPPKGHIAAILVSSLIEEEAEEKSRLIGRILTEKAGEYSQVKIIGPAKASLSKANDIYRRILYMKHKDAEVLEELKDHLEESIGDRKDRKHVTVQFDFDPMSSY